MEEKNLNKKTDKSTGAETIPGADTEKAVRMTIYFMPSTLEKLKADAKKERRAVCNHADIIIGRYFDGVKSNG